MSCIKTPMPQLKKKILFFLDKVEGTGRTKLAHQLREKDESIIYKAHEGHSSRSLSTKRSLYKSKPLEKFIILPPDYKTGKLKPVTPIRSANDKSFVYEGEAGYLIIPKKVFILPAKTSSPIVRESISIDKKVKELNSRIKELSQRSLPKFARRQRPRYTHKALSGDMKDHQEMIFKVNSLSPTQNLLLKKWQEIFNNF